MYIHTGVVHDVEEQDGQNVSSRRTRGGVTEGGREEGERGKDTMETYTTADSCNILLYTNTMMLLQCTLRRPFALYTRVYQYNTQPCINQPTHFATGTYPDPAASVMLMMWTRILCAIFCRVSSTLASGGLYSDICRERK